MCGEEPDGATGVQRLRGRVVKGGRAEGEALVSSVPVGFLGGVDPETGIVIEADHPLQAESVAGRVLVFPTGKGSTVGSYTLYRMARNGVAPAAMINAEADPVVAVGAIISEIPMVDQVDISLLRTGDWVWVEDGFIKVQRRDVGTLPTAATSPRPRGRRRRDPSRTEDAPGTGAQSNLTESSAETQRKPGRKV